MTSKAVKSFAKMLETSSTMAVPGPPSPMGKPMNKPMGVKSLEDQERETRRGRLKENTLKLNKQNTFAKKKVEAVASFLKRKQLGITGELLEKLGKWMDKIEENRTNLLPLNLAETILLEGSIKLANTFNKAGTFLSREDFHDFCQEAKASVEGMHEQLKDVAQHSRRMKSEQLVDDANQELQMEKYLRRTREWTDQFEDSLASALGRYV